MKKQMMVALLGFGLVASPVAAQGVVRGAQEGAAVGNNAAGPVGGAVGGRGGDGGEAGQKAQDRDDRHQPRLAGRGGRQQAGPAAGETKVG